MKQAGSWRCWLGIVGIWIFPKAPAAEPKVVEDFPEVRQKTQMSSCREELNDGQSETSRALNACEDICCTGNMLSGL